MTSVSIDSPAAKALLNARNAAASERDDQHYYMESARRDWEKAVEAAKRAEATFKTASRVLSEKYEIIRQLEESYLSLTSQAMPRLSEFQ